MLPFLRTSRPGRSYLAGAPLLIAHRGGARLAPENTMEAFDRALRTWEADILEMDVRVTRDGELVVVHDPVVDRVTDGTGRVAELTWPGLRELDAGYRFEDPEGRTTFRGKGVRIPRFAEVLESFPGARLNVEAKTPEAAAPLVELIRRHGAEDRVLVASSDPMHRRDARGYRGPWGASADQIRRFYVLSRLGLTRFYPMAADALQVPPRWEGREVVTRRFVRAAHRMNVPVHVWTVDDPAEMRRLLDLEVDGIQSDRPDLLARVLVERAHRPAPPGLTGRSRAPAAPDGEEEGVDAPRSPDREAT